MISVDTLEDVTKALLSNDRARALLLVEEAIDASKNKGQHKQVTRLRNVLRSIADSDYSSGYSTSSYRNTTTPTFKISSNLYTLENPNVSLDSVILSKTNSEKISEVLNEWNHKDSLFSKGLTPSNRIIMYGLPGTGKTKLANALATSLGYPVMSVYLDELMSSYLGKTGKNIREIFDVANKGKIVLFLDEIDAVAKQRDDVQDIGELKRVVTVFLQNIDKLSPETIVIGATNHEEILDRAIWRRFPVRLNLNTPDSNAREHLFELFLGESKKDIDTKLLGSISSGLTGSAIEEIAKQALKNAVLEDTKISTVELIRLVFLLTTESKNNYAKKHWDDEVYEAAQILKDSGFNLRQVESMSGVPYTTLREHVK